LSARKKTLEERKQEYPSKNYRRGEGGGGNLWCLRELKIVDLATPTKRNFFPRQGREPEKREGCRLRRRKLLLPE